MNKTNELQNIEDSKITSAEISDQSDTSKKTQIFYNHIIYSYVFTSMVNET